MAKVRDKKYKMGLIAKQLEEIRSVDENGNVSFKGMLNQELQLVLESSISLNAKIPSSERPKIFSQAVMDAALQDPITEENLIQSITRRESNFLKRGYRDYVVLTSLSIGPLCVDSLRRTIDRCYFTFSRNIHQKFDTKTLSVAMKSRGHEITPRNFLPARIRLRARSKNEAVQKALARLDRLRGIWNFCLNRKVGFRFQSHPTPVNKILLGPTHTLHHLDGSAVFDDAYWFESDYLSDTKTFNKRADFKVVLKQETELRSLINKSPYKSDIYSALVRYANALDGMNFDSNFIQLWSLLEFLTSTERQGYDQTIRRCKFLYHDYEFHGQILEHLRDQRNSFVHLAVGSDNAFQLLFQLKRYCETLLMFHIMYEPRFKKRSLACQFLDLPVDKKELLGKIRLYGLALKTRS